MKKFLAILATLLMVASVAYSLDSMKDNDMDDVTGQAGLSIQQYLSEMTINVRQEGLSWGDDDGNSETGLGGTGAGHLAIRAALSGGGQDDMGVDITISSATPIRIDVDATGIYLSMSSIGVAVASPERMQFSVAAGVVDGFAGVINGTTSEVLGDMATDNMTVTVAMPSVLRIAPH